MGIKTKKQYYSSKIGMWYTVWWQENKEPTPERFREFHQHWADWTRMIPARGEYGSGDSRIIREHMELFSKSGIDFILLDDTNAHAADNGSIAYNIDQVFKTVSTMEKAPLLSVALGGSYNNPENEKSTYYRNQEADLVYNQYVKDYPDNYFSWKGKPLLVSYGLPEYFGWNDNRFTVRHATGSVNEGIRSGYVPETGLWGWVFNNQTENNEVYGVVPGFNKGPIVGNDENSMMDQIKREQGVYYMKNWLEAIKSGREVIMITAWNDFAEEPAIEAALPRNDGEIDNTVKKVGYPMDLRHERDKKNGIDRHNIWLDYYDNPAPFWYEEITWAYLALKTTLLDGYYYNEEDSADFYQYLDNKLILQNAKPHGHPVVLIPKGYFDWFFENRKDKLL